MERFPEERPHREEFEDDVLKQEIEEMEFWATKQPVAASVVRMSNRQSKPLESLSASECENKSKPFKFDAMNPTFLNDKASAASVTIKEKSSEKCTDNPVELPSPSSVPKANSSSKMSVFAQRRKAKKEAEAFISAQVKSNDSQTEDQNTSKLEKSFDFDADTTMKNMTEHEILAAAQEYRSKLDPATLEFLKKRSAQKSPEKLRPSPSVAAPISEINFDDLPIHPEKVKQFAHMDTVEADKLAWMLPSAGSGGDGAVAGFLDARFDFKGELVLEKTDETWASGLHHHGQDMDRPGYTLVELLTLARSTNPQQRGISFDTLTAIFENAQYAMFDMCMDRSIFYSLSDMDCVFVVRKGMDSTDPLTLNSSLNCLAAMLYSIQEESSLDSSYLWPETTQPWISTAGKKGIDAEGELKDPEVCELDLLEFLILRATILDRLDYLLRVRKEILNEQGTISVLKILIRVARHSPDKIVEAEQLLRFIAESYANCNWIVGKVDRNLVGTPLALAYKLFRILIDSSLKNARIVFAKFHILASAQACLACEQWNKANRVKDLEFIMLESFKIWGAFLSYGIGVDEFLEFRSIFMNQNLFLLKQHKILPFDFSHAAHLYYLFGKVLKASGDNWAVIKDGIHIVSEFIVRVLSLMSDPQTMELLDFDCSLAALEQALELISLGRKYENFNSITKFVIKFIASSGYSAITSQIAEHSLILVSRTAEEALKELKKYPVNFTSCGATLFGGQGRLIPILRQKTPISFLTTLVRFLRQSGLLVDLDIRNLLNSDIERYLRRIATKLNLTASRPKPDNFFLRFELNCIAEYIEIQLGQPWALANFELVYKLIPLVQISDPGLFERLITLCLRVLPGSGSSKIPEAAAVFLNALLLNDINFDEKKDKNPSELNWIKWGGKIVKSKHWLLEPFRVWYGFYSQLEPDSQDFYTKELTGGVKLVLELLQFVLEESQGWEVLLGKAEDILMLYSRIALCFLMGYGLFLDPPVRELLGSILRKLGRNPLLMDQGKHIFLQNKTKAEDALHRSPSSFYALYTELLKEFGASSFGDEVFTGYILLPLRFCEGPELKQLFLTADDIIRYVKVTPEKSCIPLDYFTATKEKHPGILASINLALKSKIVTAQRQPFLYQIFKFHVSGTPSV